MADAICYKKPAETIEKAADVNKSHWACANDIELLNDVSPEDSY